MSLEGPEWVPVDVDGLTLEAFEDMVETGAKAKASKRNGSRKGAALQRRTNDGSSARANIAAKLTFLKARAGYNFATSAPILHRAANSRPSRSAASEPLSVRALAEIELIAMGLWEARDPATNAPPPNKFEQDFAAQTWAIVNGSSRFEQAQLTTMGPLTAESAIGNVARSKCRTAEGQPNYPSVLVRVSVTGHDVLQRVATSLRGFERAGFLVRDNNARNGDPFLATGFRNAPMSRDRFLVALRAMLERRVGLSAEQAACFGCSSLRRTLSEIAFQREEPAQARLELGAWASAEIRAPELRKEAQLTAMPDRYAARSKLQRAVEARARQMHAAQQLWTAIGRDAMPLIGGWELFSPSRCAAAPAPNGGAA